MRRRGYMALVVKEADCGVMSASPNTSAAVASTVVTVDDVRALALTLPRSYEAHVRGRVKFRVGSIVYCSFSRDETTMGFGFPASQ